MSQPAHGAWFISQPLQFRWVLNADAPCSRAVLRLVFSLPVLSPYCFLSLLVLTAVRCGSCQDESTSRKSRAPGGAGAQPGAWKAELDASLSQLSRSAASLSTTGTRMGAVPKLTENQAAYRLLPTVSPMRAPAPNGVLVDPISTGALKSKLGPPAGVVRIGEKSAPVATRAHISCVKDLLKRTFYTISDTSYCTPSDRIGRNYSPTAQGLTMRQLKTVLGTGKAGAGPAIKAAPPSPVPAALSLSASASTPVLGSSVLGSTLGGGTMRSSGSRAVLTPFPKPATTLAVTGTDPALTGHGRRSSLTQLRPDGEDSDDDDKMVRRGRATLRGTCFYRESHAYCVVGGTAGNHAAHQGGSVDHHSGAVLARGGAIS